MAARQRWSDGRYQRRLQEELSQMNERHEDELAELVGRRSEGKGSLALRCMRKASRSTGCIREHKSAS